MRLWEVEEAGRRLAERLTAYTLARVPISPSAITVAGALLNVAVALLLAWGYLRWAAGLMLLAACFDVADGALARTTGRVTPLGAFLDSTLDRYSEGLIGLGLLIHLLQRNAWLDIVLLYLFLVGSFIFSYARARAEAEGFTTHPGLFTRLVRLVVLALGLLAGQTRIVLWVLAVGVQGSALQRLCGVCLEARKRTVSSAPSPFRVWLKGLLAHRALREEPKSPPRPL
ncbi:MAG: CDP-alcohol phosphatidyltransferase family protein [Chloroflexia bacterium]